LDVKVTVLDEVDRIFVVESTIFTLMVVLPPYGSEAPVVRPSVILPDVNPPATPEPKAKVVLELADDEALFGEPLSP
jgi:hypothetical protein